MAYVRVFWITLYLFKCVFTKIPNKKNEKKKIIVAYYVTKLRHSSLETHNLSGGLPIRIRLDNVNCTLFSFCDKNHSFLILCYLKTVSSYDLLSTNSWVTIGYNRHTVHISVSKKPVAYHTLYPVFAKQPRNWDLFEQMTLGKNVSTVSTVQ